MLRHFSKEKFLTDLKRENGIRGLKTMAKFAKTTRMTDMMNADEYLNFYEEDSYLAPQQNYAHEMTYEEREEMEDY